MESVVFKYSDFFNDDGGFQKIRTEFNQLGDDLIKKAKEVREKTKLFDVNDSEGLSEYEKQVETLKEAFEGFRKAKVDLQKIEKAYLAQQKKGAQSTEDQIDALTKLDKELQTQRTNLKELNKLGTINGQVVEDVNKERVKTTLNIKNINKEIRKQQTEISKANELSRDEQKLLKAKLVLDKDQINTLTEVRERMSALRTVVQSLDINEQSDQIKAYNQEINDLTDTLEANSDKFIQNKINVGNYEESITNALKSSNLFKTNIAGLDAVMESVVSVFVTTNVELEVMEESADANTNAIKRMTIAFGRLNKVLKASIIGVVLVAVGALASAFGDTRAGAIRTEKVMMSLSSAFTTFGKVMSIAVSGAIDQVKTFFEGVSNLGKLSLKDILSGNFDLSSLFSGASRQVNNFSETISEIIETIKGGSEAIIEGLDNIERAFQIEDNIRRLNQEIETLNGKLQVSQLRAGDATRSLTAQLLANKESLELTEQIADKQLEIARQELEVINEKVKQNIKANGIERDNINLGLQGEAFAKATLDLAQKRGSQLEISNDLVDQQQNALLEVMKVENELQVTREQNAVEQRQINRDIFEQNLDLLIDLIDTEKNISEAYVNDVTNNFKKRVSEFNRFLMVFRANSQKELDEFTKEASNMGLDLDFQIEYDENGDFEVFVNNTRLATENIVQLNKQLQGTGMNEIDINRFREFIIESRNGIRDFRLLNKELKLAGINVKEMSENVSVSRDELNALDLLQGKINALVQTQKTATDSKERDSITKQILDLEKQKEAITEFADEQRLRNRKNAIDSELETVEEGSSRYFELLQEQIDLEKQLREKSIDDTLNKQKEANKKSLEDYKKFSDEVKKMLDSVLDKVLEVNEKRVESAEDQVETQGDLIDTQQARAEAGLENTLAFEQRELGKREAELLKRQKEQERLEKIKALYSSYQNYSSKGEENAIAKALRDFAILESISATFKDGGITGIDGVKTNRHGVTVGKRHDRNGLGGNLAWHERGEGFLPKEAVDNIGHSNFYKFREMALNGAIDSNFFSGQRKNFVNSTTMVFTDPALREELRQVREAVEQKPVPNWELDKITKGTMDIIQEVMSKNSVKRNHFKIKKPRP